LCDDYDDRKMSMPIRLVPKQPENPADDLAQQVRQLEESGNRVISITEDGDQHLVEYEAAATT
jgi:hypothetical protein